METELITRIWELITRKDTGALAFIVVAMGLVKIFLDNRKTKIEIKLLQNRLDNLPNEIRGQQIDRELATLNRHSLINKHKEITTCLEKVSSASIGLHNSVDTTFRPLLDKGKIFNKDEVDKFMKDIDIFVNQQIHRPNIENAAEELKYTDIEFGREAIEKFADDVHSKLIKFLNEKADISAWIKDDLKTYCSLTDGTYKEVELWVEPLKDACMALNRRAGEMKGWLTNHVRTDPTQV